MGHCHWKGVCKGVWVGSLCQQVGKPGRVLRSLDVHQRAKEASLMLCVVEDTVWCMGASHWEERWIVGWFSSCVSEVPPQRGCEGPPKLTPLSAMTHH